MDDQGEPDVRHAVRTLPWPFEDGAAIVIVASHVLEHVPADEIHGVLAEIHRVGHHGARVFISGPYGIGYRFLQDPTHVTPVVEGTFAWWDPRFPELYDTYRLPPMHLISFERVAALDDVDYNAVLAVCKDPGSCRWCDRGPAPGDQPRP